MGRDEKECRPALTASTSIDIIEKISVVDVCSVYRAMPLSCLV